MSILFNVALVHLKQKSFERSEQFATKALQIDSNHSKCLFRRAAACYVIGLKSKDDDVVRLTTAKYDLMRCQFHLKQDKNQRMKLSKKFVRHCKNVT